MADIAMHNDGDHEKVTDKRMLKRSHNLPHWQFGGGVYFLTFRSNRGRLPDNALKEVKECIVFGHGKKYDLFFAVVMPDHVHILFRPLRKEKGEWFDLAEIMKGIKGVSSRRINKVLGTKGRVWMRESFDRIIRDEREFNAKVDYMYFNPVKAGLVRDPEQYEFIVRRPFEIGIPDDYFNKGD
jgi:REP element-mobilizing transposase RayT